MLSAVLYGQKPQWLPCFPKNLPGLKLKNRSVLKPVSEKQLQNRPGNQE
jgi:hypothetical protein